jgi:hypothetical protein
VEIHGVEAATSSINSNLMRWVIDLVVHQIPAVGTQTTSRGGLMMAEVYRATISIHSNLMMWVMDLVEL